MSFLLRYWNRKSIVYPGQHYRYCGRAFLKICIFMFLTTSWGPWEKFRANFFLDIFIWFDVVLNGLSENEARFLESTDLPRNFSKIHEKSEITKTEFFWCKFCSELEKSNRIALSKAFCREFISLSFEMFRGSQRQIFAEKNEKYEKPRKTRRKVKCRECFVHSSS